MVLEIRTGCKTQMAYASSRTDRDSEPGKRGKLEARRVLSVYAWQWTTGLFSRRKGMGLLYQGFFVCLFFGFSLMPFMPPIAQGALHPG